MLKQHPAAESFPLMDEKRLVELTADIERHGQRVKIVMADGMVLDGRNRWLACEKLNRTPETIEFKGGDPWAFVWSLNGQRRDLVELQRYLIWKHCNEHSESWAAEQQRIKDEANAKRSRAAKGMPYAPKGGTRKTDEKVPVQDVQAPCADSPGRQAKAAAANVGVGTVARGDALANKRPDLADKVRLGEMKPAEALRESKRAEVVESLESVAAKKAKAIRGVYDVIVIDPPWPMQKIERDERPNQVEFSYPTMQEDELAKLKIHAAEDCHVWLWTTHKFLPMAFRLLDTWGLKYVCAFVWHKPGGFQPVGLPQYNCEFALYARKGSPKFIDTKGLPVCFEAPRGEHSEKPEGFYSVLRRVTAGRRLDMFNRRVIEGFDGWGKEAAGG